MGRKKIIGAMLIIIVFLGITTTVQAKNIVIALDPGHGGKMSGAVNGNLVEKDITLSIARYTKKYLDQYLGVTTVLTHNGLASDYELDLEERANIAMRYGADIMISQHINDNKDKEQHGAEVYVTTNTSKKEYKEGSTILGNKILKNLAKLGIYNRGVLTRPGTIETDRYPDGSIADYYAVIRHPVNRGFPGIIIEHCFIENPKDIIFIDSNEDLKKLGKADANAIADYYQLKYQADINCEIGSIRIQKIEDKYYLIGNNIILDWIKGESETPRMLPKMTLKSTDGKVSLPMYIKQEKECKYYFDRNITGIDTSKTYYIEVSSGDKRNVSNNNKMTAKLSNKVLGKYGKYDMKLQNNRINFTDTTYIGDINSELQRIQIIQSDTKRDFISGNIVIVEWIDGKSTVPKKLPIMTFKSTDGTIKEPIYVKQMKGNIYYFDKDIQKIDLSKTYYIELKSASIDNVSKYKTQKVIGKDTKIGTCRKTYATSIKGSSISFKDESIYKADINTQVLKMNLNEKSGYITGKIVIVEWINGKTSSVPKEIPIIKMISEDKKIEVPVYVKQISGNTYYFDRNIQGMDMSKNYFIEVSSASIKNKSVNKTQKITYTKQLGTFQKKKLMMQSTKLYFK